MQISIEEMNGGITRVVLDGRMDIEGAAAVDLKLNVAAGSSQFLLLDMQKVSFLGSMGLGTLVAPAQAVRRRGGKVVVFAPTPMVEAVFITSKIDTLIPIHHELGSALAALQ